MEHHNGCHLLRTLLERTKERSHGDFMSAELSNRFPGDTDYRLSISSNCVFIVPMLRQIPALSPMVRMQECQFSPCGGPFETLGLSYTHSCLLYSLRNPQEDPGVVESQPLFPSDKHFPLHFGVKGSSMLTPQDSHFTRQN